jgi:ribose-phosphate pyrophosphokinase
VDHDAVYVIAAGSNRSPENADETNLSALRISSLPIRETSRTTVFALPDFEQTVPKRLAPEHHGELAIERFANGELHVELLTDVRGRVCSLIGSVTPPDTELVSLLLAAHTLKKEGAARVVAVLPYLAYARQDEPKPGSSLAAAWVGSLLAAAEVDRVVTIDVHSPKVRDLFAIPLESLSPAPLFAREIRALGLKDPTIVSPDEGAIARCHAVADAAGITRPVAFLRKHRDAEGVRHSALVGEISPNVVIVDDILDTGGTLLSCCAELRRRGAERITVIVTHGLFTGSRWTELWSLGVKEFYVTDTVPQAAHHPPTGVTVIPAAAILDEAIVGPATG